MHISRIGKTIIIIIIIIIMIIIIITLSSNFIEPIQQAIDNLFDYLINDKKNNDDDTYTSNPMNPEVELTTISTHSPTGRN